MKIPARQLLTGAALVILSASCSTDRTVSPHGVPSIAGNPALKSLVVAQTVNLTIPAAGGSLAILDVYNLEVPAGAVCDPDAADTQTGYANAVWDSSCTPANRDIDITATVKAVNGKLYVDFAPSLRFVPTKRVLLSTNVLAPVVQYFSENEQNLGFEFPFSRTIEGESVPDALTDPSLRTVVVGGTGKVYRRVKHFTGYMIVFNGQYIPCDPQQGDPQCVWVNDE